MTKQELIYGLVRELEALPDDANINIHIQRGMDEWEGDRYECEDNHTCTIRIDVNGGAQVRRGTKTRAEIFGPMPAAVTPSPSRA